MESLFENNAVILFLIACIAIISYTNFRDNQRMFLLYLFAYAVATFSIFRIRTSLLLLFTSTFIFLEYLSEDTRKLEIVVKLRYKVVDYFFLMVFQYEFVMVFIAFSLLFISKHSESTSIARAIQIISIVLLVWGEQKTVSQPFKIKSVTDTLKIFEENPPYQFQYNERMQPKFDLLCEFEDQSYFCRKNSYSSFSLEYLSYWFKRHQWNLVTVKQIVGSVPSIVLGKGGFRLYGRGYSTPEMQLLRTIGIARGYDRYKFRRKIYEILYSKILFSSLKTFHQANTYLELNYYREYILWIYFKAVLSKIKGVKYFPLSTAFQNCDDIANWSLNGLFIVCLGLSFRDVTTETLDIFDNIIQKFNLSRDEIIMLYEMFPEHKFPPKD